MPQMTVTRALVELKTLDARILKAISNLKAISVRQRDTDHINGVPVAQFEAEAKAEFQSVQDLIAYRNRVKAAVIRSNANLSIDISGQQYTVAEAIERKATLKYERELISTLRNQVSQAERVLENHNAQLDYRVDQHLTQLFGSDKKDVTKVTELTKQLKDGKDAVLVDPIGARKAYQDRLQELENFEKEVDVVLSEANATSLIDV